MRRLTHEEVVNCIKQKAGSEYELIGEYKNINTSVLMKHNIDGCGYTWSVPLSNFIYHGTRCPKCHENVRKMTDEQFKEKLKKRYGNEYKPLEEYTDSYTKIRMLHTKCGNVILKRPNDILNGYECNICNKYHKKTSEEFNEELQKIYGDEYKAIEEYTDAHTPIFFKHKCETTFRAKPYMMLQGKRKCPKCKENSTPTEDELREMIKNAKDGDDYLLVSGYKNMNKKALFLHKKCEKTFFMKPTEFIVQEHRCIHCSKNKKYTTESFRDKVLEETDGEYLPLGSYKNNKIKISMKHFECGYVWNVRPDAFLHGSRCPICSNSRGNRKIKKYLVSNDIKHIAEYRIKECKYKRTLPFDFAIFDDSDNLKLLIEYQGRQHEEVVEQFGGKKGLKERMRNDGIKKKYCESNNIELLPIKYSNFKNIGSILEQKLKEVLNRVT